MHNIIDYINWRGDISFINDSFNEVDNIILSRISYFPWDKIITKKKSIMAAFKNLREDISFLEDDKHLFELLASSNRFKDLIIDNVESKTSLKEEIQFFAITILLPNNMLYVSFRGTDNSVVGLKEDFNMSFESDIPSQINSVRYLNNVYLGYSKFKIIVGGHSKGGNLAIYSAMNSEEKVKDNIVKVYNNDGPGFLSDVVGSNKYKNILNKIITYIPQTSIVGRLLNHEEGYIIINSDQKGIMQHNLYNWNILGNHFIYENTLTKESEKIEKILKDWLNSLTCEERQKVIDVVYDLLISSNITDRKQFTATWYKHIKEIINSYQNVSKEDKKMLGKAFKYLLSNAKIDLLDK